MQKNYWSNLDDFEDWDEHCEAVLSFIDLRGRGVVERAIDIIGKHHDQPRYLYRGIYNRHPLRVARILLEEFNVRDANMVLIALCHDLGEWSEYDIRNLKDELGIRVFDGVNMLTWNKNQNWEEFIDSIVKHGDMELLQIKIADKLDNVRGVIFSDNIKERNKAYERTDVIMRPIIEKYFPNYWIKFDNVLKMLKST